MANRSYLYVIDRIPTDSDPVPRVSGVMEWKSEVPICHILLVSGNAQECPSLIWGEGSSDDQGREWPAPKAIVGDARMGIANLERAFAQLPSTPKIQQEIAAARTALAEAIRKGPYFLLEHAEITFDFAESPDEALAEYQGVLRQAQSPDDLVAYVARHRDASADEVTGAGGYWSSTLYFSPIGSAVDEAPVEPERGIPSFQPPTTQAPPGPPPMSPHPAPYPPQPYPAAYQLKPDYGTTPWALGFLVWLPIPFLSVVIAGLAMLFSGRGKRLRGGLAAQNGTNAANWGATAALLMAVLLSFHGILLYVLTKDGPVSGFFPLGIAPVLMAVLIVVHAIVTIVGTVKASKGKVFRMVAFPFLR
ncbi:DUF7822 domain-containing protein [Tessaracoccus caeni]|uniref:DUF7822 domain-containing protein n=1 Tax=Tessaracoccus caeni TaxID=3031239 RepID=UPI0023D9FD9B|nr:hypothetical protein [Tessaracoccus caeni]MDF1487643.1 hypothetical protein [Tessaracoccus caeni]